MNPTKDEIDYDSLSSEQLAEIVQDRLRQMAQWDPEEVMREQLRLANVSESRIKALYPFNFSNLCSELKERMSGSSLSHLTNSSTLSWVVDETNRLMGPLSPAHKNLIDPEPPGAEFTARIEDLQFHVLNCLPAQSAIKIPAPFNSPGVSAEEERKSFASALVIVLWYATGLLFNLDAIQPRDAGEERRRVHKYFCKVTDIALPQFKVLEEVRDRIASYLTATWH